MTPVDEPTLRSFLIPFPGGQAVLPNSLVVEVLPFATPLKIGGAPPWVVGAVLWQARTTPVVSLGRLLGDEDSSGGGHARILVVKALGGDPKLSHYGLLASGAPHPLSLKCADVVPDEQVTPDEDAGRLWLSRRVRVNGEPVVIPNLDAIEAALAPLLGA